MEMLLYLYKQKACALQDQEAVERSQKKKQLSSSANSFIVWICWAKK